MAEVLHVETREMRGKRNAKRLRAAGRLPAILYGHGKECVALSIVAEDVDAVIRHGTRLVTLQGGAEEDAFVKEVQWDPFGAHVLHLDLTRVKAGELVEIALAIELRGDAPGTRHGGVVEHHMHEIQIECPVSAIPEKLSLSINNLEVGQSLTTSDLDLPAGSRLLVESETAVVSCVEMVEAPDEETAEPGEGAEPEIIGRKAEEGEDAS